MLTHLEAAVSLNESMARLFVAVVVGVVYGVSCMTEFEGRCVVHTNSKEHAYFIYWGVRVNSD